MARARGFTRPPPRRARLASQWDFAGDSVLTTLIPGASTIPFGFAANTDITLLRSHLSVWIQTDQTAALEEQMVAVGLIIVSDKAFALGVTAVPLPFTNGTDDGWVLHKSIYQASAGSLNGMTPPVTYVDSKGMRKFQDGETLALVIENHHATFSATVVASLRVLTKLTQQ